MVITPYEVAVLILRSYKKLKARKLTTYVICSVKLLTNYNTKFNPIFKKTIF